MTSLRDELEGLKSKYTKENLSKQDYLQLAYESIDLHLKFLKLANSVPEKKRLTEKTNHILDEAEKVKKTETWSPESGMLIDFDDDPETDTVPDVKASPKPSISTTPRSETSSLLREPSETPRQHPKSSLNSYGASLRLLAPTAAPTSSRQLPTHEQTLLWRNSALHGCKFPPWQSDPEEKEFGLARGEQPFLCVDRTNFNMSREQKQILDTWKRPHDALPPPTLSKGETSSSGSNEISPSMKATRPSDFVQDAATDCSVVASLAAGAARGQRGHAKLLSSLMFPYDSTNQQPRLSPNGRYVIRLNFNGCARRVVIDDRLPVSKNERLLHVIDRNNPGLLWPALVEKAYLKVRGGYDFPGSNSGTDLWILSGWIPEQIFIQDDETDETHLWQRMYEHSRGGDVLITLGTPKMTEQAEIDIGLAGEHDYAVLDLKEEKGRRVMLIKNPWLNATTYKDRRLMGSLEAPSSASSDSDLAPGCFWMELGDVMQHFESMYLNWNPNFFEHRQDIHFIWDLSEGHSPVGSLVDHPQFYIGIPEGGAAWLLLQKHFDDASEPSSTRSSTDGVLGLYAFQGAGQRIHRSKGASDSTPFVDSPQILLRLDAPPATKYTVVPAAEDLIARQYTFTLSVFSTTSFKLDQAQSAFKCKTNEQAAWTQATAGGNSSSERYSQNPQYSFTLSSDSAVSIALQSMKETVSLNFKLVHGRGERVFTVSSKDIIMDSRDYRKGIAHAQIANVMAGTYTIICSTFEPGQLADFMLTVESNVDHQIKPVPREGAGQLRHKLAPLSFASGVRTVAAPMQPNRMARLSFKARHTASSTSDSSRSSDGGTESPAGRSPTRLTVEVGRGGDRTILISSGNGSFIDSTQVMRTDVFDINAKMTKRQDMWLVVERLMGYEGASEAEERVKVEMSADVPDAVQIGVWRPIDR